MAGDGTDFGDFGEEIGSAAAARQEDDKMSFIDGVLAIAGIGGGRDTTTVSSNGSTVVLALALAGVLVVLIYAGMSVKGKR